MIVAQAPTMTEQVQSYANHRRGFTAPYAIAGVAILAAACMRGYELAKAPSLSTGASLLLAFGCLILWYCVRAGDLTLQNRVIRAEMHARLGRLLGEARRHEFERLTPRQLIGLRFASDAELPALVAEVLAGTTTDQDAIKRKVRDWQADQLRV